MVKDIAASRDDDVDLSAAGPAHAQQVTAGLHAQAEGGRTPDNAVDLDLRPRGK
jgi:hypothetical protein